MRALLLLILLLQGCALHGDYRDHEYFVPPHLEVKTPEGRDVVVPEPLYNSVWWPVAVNQIDESGSPLNWRIWIWPHNYGWASWNRELASGWANNNWHLLEVGLNFSHPDAPLPAMEHEANHAKAYEAGDPNWKTVGH